VADPMLVVVGALVMPGPPWRILLGQRTHRSDFAWHWECPGGKVEVDETPRTALRREFHEELHIPVMVGDLLHEQAYGPEDGCRQPCIVQLYAVLPTCNPVNRMKANTLAVAGYGWFPLPLLRHLPLVVSLRNALPRIEARYG
jgi:8-oxo-dGTP pyrophosphatase MutT (NUDIX family)